MDQGKGNKENEPREMDQGKWTKGKETREMSQGKWTKGNGPREMSQMETEKCRRKQEKSICFHELSEPDDILKRSFNLDLSQGKGLHGSHLSSH